MGIAFIKTTLKGVYEMTTSNTAALPEEFNLEPAVSDEGELDSENLLSSDTYWEMQEEAEMQAREEAQRARQYRAGRGYYIGLDW